MVGLTKLNLMYTNKITNIGLKPLVNLTTLKLRQNRKISDTGLLYLINLTRLFLDELNHKFTRLCINQLTDKGVKIFY